MCTKPLGGFRVEIPLAKLDDSTVFTEGDFPEKSETLVIGKNENGLKISALKLALKDVLEENLSGENEHVWIYESFLSLNVIGESVGNKNFKSQKTNIHPLVVPFPNVNSGIGRLTSSQNIADGTGQFKKISREPTRDRLVTTDFTETLQQWRNPYSPTLDKENYGFALVNSYSDGSPETTSAKDIRYYGFHNNTDTDPYIDICYKIVEIPHCKNEDGDIVEGPSNVTKSVVLVNDGKNHNGETLAIGTDLTGTTFRSVLQFDISEMIAALEEDLFEYYYVPEILIHLNYLGPSEGPDGRTSTRTFTVHEVTNDWDETTATWDNIVYSEEDISSQVNTVEQERLGGTMYTIRVQGEAVQRWIEEGQTEKGFILIDTQEELESRVPQFADNTDGIPDGEYVPYATICHKGESPVNPTSTATPPSSSQGTFTTPFNLNAPTCGAKFKEPVEPITVLYDPKNETVTEDPDLPGVDLCVSTRPIELGFCWDLTSKCRKSQEVNIHGVRSTKCECCLPSRYQHLTETFDCTKSGRKTLEIKVIETCNCSECDSSHSEKEELFRRR